MNIWLIRAITGRSLLMISILIVASCSYLPVDYDPGNYETLVDETADYVLISSSGNVSDKGFVFVPGGFVDPHVYICWLQDLAIQYPDLTVVVLKVPSNLAITNMGKVEIIMEQFQEIKHWVIGGHSLGGVVSAFSVSDSPNAFEGMILMASWATESSNLNGWEGTVLSIYASNDGLASVDEIESNKAFLPPGELLVRGDSISYSHNKTYYYLIEGGNHSGFGCYGLQDKDNEATITQDEQQEEIVSIVHQYFSELWD